MAIPIEAILLLFTQTPCDPVYSSALDLKVAKRPDDYFLNASQVFSNVHLVIF